METNQKNEYIQTATNLSCCFLLAITSIMSPFYMPFFFGIISSLGTLGAAYFIAASNEPTKKMIITIYEKVSKMLDFGLTVTVNADEKEEPSSTRPSGRRGGKTA